MNLISKSKIDNIIIKYYDGMDLNVVSKHPKDGSKGVLVCFIKNWKASVRNNKIDNVLTNEKIININDINNNNVIIYQVDNIPIIELYDVVKDKLENGSFDSKPWVAIAGIDKGGWKIGNIGIKT